MNVARTMPTGEKWTRKMWTWKNRRFADSIFEEHRKESVRFWCKDYVLCVYMMWAA